MILITLFIHRLARIYIIFIIILSFYVIDNNTCLMILFRIYLFIIMSEKSYFRDNVFEHTM